MSDTLRQLPANELLALIDKLESGDASEVIESLTKSGVAEDSAASLVASYDAGDTDLFFSGITGRVYDAASLISLRQRLEGLDIPGYDALEPMASTLLSDLFKATRELEGGGQQDVVIKIYKESEKDERRSLFDRERRVLARMNHPNTLRLLDTGMCKYGPFLVTEYLDASPLDQWLKENRADDAALSKVVLQVLDATEYLHSRLLLHRDIKPSNVMVSTNGQVKLIDYGIAGELSIESAGAATMLGAMSLLTATPEQLEGQSADVRSDVYQLGMLVSYVHSGSQPFGSSDNPSQLRDDKHFERFGFDRQERGTARQVNPRLRPILEKAMRWKQQDRYHSVSEFKEDYQRYLEWREPRYAQKSRSLALRLFVRRHNKWLLPMAVTTLAALIFSAFIYRQYLHIQEISDDLASSLAASNMVTEVFFDAMREVNPDYSSRGPTEQTNKRAARSGEITRAALERYRSLVRPDKTLDLKVRLGLARAFVELSLTTTALELLQELPLERYRDSVDQELFGDLALTWLQVLVDQGRIEEAQEIVEELDQLILPPGQAIEFVTYEVRLSQFRGEREGASEIIDQGKQLLGPNPSASMKSWHFYRTAAESMASFAQHQEAETLYNLADAALDQLNVPADATRRRVIQAGLGNIFLDQGRYQEALPIFDSLLAVEKELYVDAHPNLAATYNNLARAQMRSNQVEKALVNMRESVDIYEQSLGKRHTRYLTGRFNYGATLLSAGKTGAAIEILKENTNAYSALQPGGLNEAISGLKLAEAYLADNQHELAMTHFSGYLPILLESLGETHPRVAINRCRFARALALVGDPMSANQAVEQAMPTMLKTFGAGHPLLKECDLPEP